MSKWLKQWPLLKDVILTFGGLAVIGWEVASGHLSKWALITGLALTGLGGAFQIGPLSRGSFGLRSSPRPSPESSPELERSEGGGEE
jgi:hypothetical protein